MNINNENINKYFDKYINDVDAISNKYNYPNNIKHLLYLIVPTFIIKYGLENENLIISCFKNIPIIINDVEDKKYQAAYVSELKYNDGYYVNRYIMLNNYTNIDLMQLLDNLMHEYNHAVNSYINNMRETDDFIYIRAGLANLVFDKKKKDKLIKEDKYILEEIINTKQTEKMIDIINSFNNYNINNVEITNTLYSIKNSNYKSLSYSYQMLISKILTDNKTFYPTIEKLRLKGEMNDVEYWFDNITGNKNSFTDMISLLKDVFDLLVEYDKKRFFKKTVLNKIKGKTDDIKKIMLDFDNNCVFK